MRMKISVLVAVAAMLISGSAAAKVCYMCEGKRPHAYVCAERDTFTARRNAARMGCKVTGTTSTCKCGAYVKHRTVGLDVIRHLLGLD